MCVTGALTAAILWGDGDFSATVGYAAQAGLDADSIGATAGSWAGAFLGEQAIPAHWTNRCTVARPARSPDSARSPSTRWRRARWHSWIDSAEAPSGPAGTVALLVGTADPDG
jgi:ADP-ribosylglycohydrolase